MKTMKSVLPKAGMIFLIFTLLCGVIYTGVVTGIAQLIFPDNAPEIRCHQVLGHGRRRGLPCRLGQVQDVGSGYDQPRGYVPCLTL